MEYIYSRADNFRIQNKIGVYYCTYGGGPEGGYFFWNKKWYQVEIKYGDDWTIKYLPLGCKVVVDDDQLMHIQKN